MSIRSYKALLWVAVVGAALAILLFPLSLFAQQADVASATIEYDENGTDPVRDFDSKDPEGAGIIWSIRGVDAADFTIDGSGVLGFVSPPDHENPTDRAQTAVTPTDLNGDGDTEDIGETVAAVTGGDNNYQITVSATEVWNASNESLPAKRSDIDLTVTVSNVDDPGELTLEWLQAEVGVAIEAIPTDPDGTVSTSGTVTGTTPATELGYTWQRSKVADPEIGDTTHWNVIDGATGATYTPQEADDGKYLWVRVRYTDPQNTIPNDADSLKTADVKSIYTVRAAAADNDSPDFGTETTTRTVSEDLAVGDPVGAAVTATDPDGDTLTYELDNDADRTTAPADDALFFNVDQATGQITVADELDADAGDGEYEIIVRATDPSGVADAIQITITVENANEAPSITGTAVLSVSEGSDYVVFPTSTGRTPLLSANEYLASQPEEVDSIASWDLAGPDAGAFDLAGTFEPRWLNLKADPDYENPTDANRDNVYEVTIVATDDDPLDTGAEEGRITVWVVVHNVQEDGEVVFTAGDDAFVNEDLVAQVEDPDDHGGTLGEPYEGVHIVSWQWSRSETGAFDADDTTDEIIEDETTNRYTPKRGDRGYYLRVTATYTDPFSVDDNATTPADERVADDGDPNTNEDSLRTEFVTTDHAVQLARGPASSPAFSDAASGVVTRRVAENTGPGGNVGAPVAADPVDETGGYSLDGADKEFFSIDSDSGQITVGGDIPEPPGPANVTEEGGDPDLNLEASKNTYSVTVTAKSGTQTTTVTVNIVVTGVNEPPEVMVEDDADGTLLPRFDDSDPPVEQAESENYDENGTEPVVTYTAEDPEGLAVSWDLRGADASLFSINGGALRFVNSPNYENPASLDGDNTATEDAEPDDSVYSVIVRAIADRASGDTGRAQVVQFRVDVTVGDEDEDGAISLSRLQPEAAPDEDSPSEDTDPLNFGRIDTEIEATLFDPDGNVTITGWAWHSSRVTPSILEIDEDDHWQPLEIAQNYTPDDDDVNKFLRVSVTYTDVADDAPKTVYAMTANPVQAAEGGFNNGSPDLDLSVAITVAENVAVGANVGRIRADVESTSQTDRLTYSLRAYGSVINVDDAVAGVTAPADDATAVADAAAFEIDQTTGQITTAGRLDFESRPTPASDPHDGKYVVVVEVVDPSGLGDKIVVVITASDVNENPVLSGRAELTIEENFDGNTSGDSLSPAFTSDEVFDGNERGQDPTVNVYEVTDRDRRAGISRWDLVGEDAAHLRLIDTGGRTLVFTTKPDFETPADADGDNVYKVTVVAIDNNGGRGEFDVCIEVRNVDEDGTITVVDDNGDAVEQPYAGQRLTVVLEDEDGGVNVTSWAWATSSVNPLGDTTPTPITGDGGATGGAITSRSYRPVNADSGNFLHVAVTYTDLFSAANTTNTETFLTKYAVEEGGIEGKPPVFMTGDGVGIESVRREVAENSPAGTFLGGLLPEATDEDGSPITYTLKDVMDGDVAKFFALREVDDDDNQTTDDIVTLQLVVAQPIPDEDPDNVMYDPVDLDHEDSDANTFTVVLEASDGGPMPDSITVNITVTDRNETPSAPAEAEDDTTTPPTTNSDPAFEAGPIPRRVAQGTAANVDFGPPVAATDADDDTLTYSLGGADASSFSIDDTGQLSTAIIIPDASVKASYVVEVIAVDGKDGTASVDVTITVTAAGGLGDADGNGSISRAEVIEAYRAYVRDGLYTRTEMIGIYRQYVLDAAGA